MATLQDVQEEVEGVPQALSGRAQALLSASASLIGARATGTYMSDAKSASGPRKVSIGPLRIVEGRLARSLTGARGQTGASEGIQRIERTGRGWRLTYGSRVPYAAIHEFGGRIRITQSMRNFFWAQHMESSGLNAQMWKRMALTPKSHIDIPERAYLRPALRDALPRIREMAEEEMAAAVTTSLEG